MAIDYSNGSNTTVAVCAFLLYFKMFVSAALSGINQNKVPVHSS